MRLRVLLHIQHAATRTLAALSKNAILLVFFPKRGAVWPFWFLGCYFGEKKSRGMCVKNTVAHLAS
jgi:hypothetical protein